MQTVEAPPIKNESKQKLSAALERDIKKYLDSGGKIETVCYGIRCDTPINLKQKLWNEQRGKQ